jgi:hypothetical protein
MDCGRCVAASSAKNYVNTAEQQFQFRPRQLPDTFAEQIPIQG